MTETGRRWRSTLQTSLVWGVAAVFISLVGLVEALSVRQIIVGIISVGHSLLLLTAVGAGFQAARRQEEAGPFAVLTAGALAGAVVGACVAVVVAIASVMNLRAVLVSASPALFDLLSFGRGPAGLYLVLLAGAAAGGLGGTVLLLPAGPRRAILTGLSTVFAVGLFQELVQLVLQGEDLRSTIRELFFTPDGLSLAGAVIVFGLAIGSSLLLQHQRPRLQQQIKQLPPGPRRVLQIVGFLVALAAILVVPLFAGLFLSQVLVLVGLYTLMGLGLNLEVGFAGLLDIGFVAFFAIGAYTVGLLTTAGPLAIAHLSWWAAVPIAVVVSLIAGVIFGLPILGIRGDYLAIATLGFGEIIRLLVLSDFLRPWLGGSQGVLFIPKPMLGSFEFSGPQQLFYLTLGASALVAFVAARLRDSRLGRAWMALREDEDVAEAMGINLVNIKLLAYGIGATFAGMSGAIFAVMVGSVFPHSFSVLISINVLALIIVGGMGSLPGVMVGSLALVGLPELLREFSDFRFLVYGAALILMMQLRPEGLWPAATVKRELHEEVAVTAQPGEQEELAGARGADS